MVLGRMMGFKWITKNPRVYGKCKLDLIGSQWKEKEHGVGWIANGVENIEGDGGGGWLVSKYMYSILKAQQNLISHSLLFIFERIKL